MAKLSDFLIDPDVKVDPSKEKAFTEYIKREGLEHEIITKEHYNDFLKRFVDVRGTITKDKPEANIEIVKSFKEPNRKRTIEDWIKYYNSKFEKLRSLLFATRPELGEAISIVNLKNKKDGEKVVLIGMIYDINTLFGRKRIILEDPTGVVTCYLKAEGEFLDELVPDEVIGVIGTKYRNGVTVNKVIFPDIPEKPLKKAKDDVYACYTSDIHVGSKMFLEDRFLKFIRWLRGEDGELASRKIAKKVKYLFIMGDNVDGVGVFPNQKKFLNIMSVEEQYKKLTEYLKMIPKDIQIIMIPGDHDATRLAEPQPPIPEEFAGDLYSLDNLTLVSNPSMIVMHKTDDFEGYLNLIYHGNSVIPYIHDIPSLREKGMEKADWALHFLLRKRHIAPSHSQSRIAPTPDDYLFIDKVPDIFAIGHVHFCDVSKYKQTITLTSSCWQNKTDRQEKLGLNPHPAVVPTFSLKDNRVIKVRFDNGL